jgi:hypothetical protein
MKSKLSIVSDNMYLEILYGIKNETKIPEIKLELLKKKYK